MLKIPFHDSGHLKYPARAKKRLALFSRFIDFARVKPYLS